MIRFAVLLIAAAWLQASHAQTVAVSAFDKFMQSTVGNAVTVGFGSSGTPLVTTASSGLPTGNGWTQAGNFGAARAATASGGINLAARASIPLQGGRTLPLTIASKITPANLFKGFRAVAGPGLLFTGLPLLLQWMADSGVTPNANATGAGDQFLMADPDVCTVAPCYLYSVSGAPNTAAYKSNSYVKACQAYVAYRTSVGPYEHRYTSATPSACSYEQNQGWAWVAGGTAMTSTSVPPSTASGLPRSMDDIAPYMQAVQPAPGVINEMTSKGVALDVDKPTVSGPSTVAGDQTKTTAPDGKVTTITNNYQITYQGDTINVTKNETTTVFDPATGQTQTSTTEAKEDLQLPADTPLSDIPTLYEQKYPDGMTGVWNTRKAELMATPLVSLLGNLFPTITGDGACPQFSLNIDLGRWHYGNQLLGPPCFVWDFMKVVLIITALFWARRLIFGG